MAVSRLSAVRLGTGRSTHFAGFVLPSRFTLAGRLAVAGTATPPSFRGLRRPRQSPNVIPTNAGIHYKLSSRAQSPFLLSPESMGTKSRDLASELNEPPHESFLQRQESILNIRILNTPVRSMRIRIRICPFSVVSASPCVASQSRVLRRMNFGFACIRYGGSCFEFRYSIRSYALCHCGPHRPGIRCNALDK